MFLDIKLKLQPLLLVVVCLLLLLLLLFDYTVDLLSGLISRFVVVLNYCVIEIAGLRFRH